MAGKNFDFQGKFGWEKGWESDFSKIRILENPDLFTNLALDNLIQIFGEDKWKTFEAVRFMVPAIPENDLKRIRKCFFSCIDTFLGNKDKLRKNKSKLEPFFDSTSFFKDLSSRLVTCLVRQFLLQHLKLTFILTDGHH